MITKTYSQNKPLKTRLSSKKVIALHGFLHTLFPSKEVRVLIVNNLISKHQATKGFYPLRVSPVFSKKQKMEYTK